MILMLGRVSTIGKSLEALGITPESACSCKDRRLGKYFLERLRPAMRTRKEESDLYGLFDFGRLCFGLLALRFRHVWHMIGSTFVSF